MRFSTALIMLACLNILHAQSIPPPRYITDEEQIRIILQRIEQGIKDQDILSITDGFAPVVAIDDSTTATKGQFEVMIKAAFTTAESRREEPRFKALTPPGANLTSTWDFEMEIDTVRILNDQTALAQTWIYFGAAQPDSASELPFGKKHRENILFEKVEGEWRVKRVGRLLDVLADIINN